MGFGVSLLSAVLLSPPGTLPRGWWGRREESTGPSTPAGAGGSQVPAHALSLQYEIIKTALEFNISNLSWDTAYCISVEPDVASRPTRTTRTNEQCVTIGKRDSEWRGSQGRGVLAGRGSSSASWPWRADSVPPLQSALRTDSLPFPPHLGTSSLAGSTELVLSIGSSFFITLLLLGLLGALLVCTYLKKPVRPPSVLVRQPGTGHPLCRCEGASLGSCWGRLTTSRDEPLLTPLFPLLPRNLS